MQDKPLPPLQPSNLSLGSPSVLINLTQIQQYYDYHQKLELIYQQLSAGQTQLKELQKNPQKNQQKVC